ncbi:DUF6624 domain-containing protein [Pedobacter sp. Leaf132]|uniref:DUF6624 domain-containing protein n=1 Tax=Pedobacter sp. Leaf132 TaxID=2876557 RepID=UPI001E49B368|nr:DUF6624 domain-containing protein [Pedobacter sp. Leaf132]
MRFSIMIVLSLISLSVAGQQKLNSVLVDKISAMFEEDQKWRTEYNKINFDEKSDFNENTINKKLAETDSINLQLAKEIINKYGFPGYSLVGSEGSNKFWSIIQHCDDDLAFQKKVLLLMDNEVKRKNASASNNAMLRDRVLVSEGKKQIYGTQVRYNAALKKSQPFPIENPDQVDSRRKSVGLSTLAEYLKLFNR